MTTALMSFLPENDWLENQNLVFAPSIIVGPVGKYRNGIIQNRNRGGPLFFCGWSWGLVDGARVIRAWQLLGERSVAYPKGESGCSTSLTGGVLILPSSPVDRDHCGACGTITLRRPENPSLVTRRGPTGQSVQPQDGASSQPTTMVPNYG